MGNCTVGSIVYQSAGSEKKAEFAVTLSSSYATGGDSFTAAQIGFAQINKIILETEKGYFFEADIASDKLSAKIKAYDGGVPSFTPAGTNGTSTVTLATTVDEVVAVSAGTGTLTNIPAIIQNVHALTLVQRYAPVIRPEDNKPKQILSVQQQHLKDFLKYKKDQYDRDHGETSDFKIRDTEIFNQSSFIGDDYF